MLDAQRVNIPTRSRFQGYESCFVRELHLKAELGHDYLECWIMPDGKAVLVSLPAGVVGGSA